MAAKKEVYTAPAMTYDSIVAQARRIASGTQARAEGSGAESDKEDDSDQWTPGVASLADAVALAEKGWADGTKVLLGDTGITAGVEDAPYWGLEVYGQFPCVPAYLAGEPEHMYNLETGTRERARVHLVFSVGVCAGASAESVMAYGRALVALIRNLEAGGVSVALSIVKISQDTRHSKPDQHPYHVFPVTIRGYGEYLDIDRLAFVCGNAAFPRRIMFSNMEACGAGVALTTRGYGYTLDELPRDIVLDTLGEGGEAVVILPTQQQAQQGEWTSEETYTAMLAAYNAASGHKQE